MIAKQTRGNRMRGLVLYLFGPGRHEEHRDPRLVAVWEPRAGDGRLGAEEIGDLVDELDAPVRLHGTQVARGYVWQCSLRNHDEDRVLSDADWAAIAAETIGRLGFGRCRWAAVRHADNHIHLAVNLVQEDGRVARLSNDRRTLSAACADFERRYGLLVRAQRGGAGMPGLSRAELERPARLGRPEPDRVGVARRVRAAAGAARSEPEFLERARAQGLVLRPRWAAGGREQVVGYSVAVAGDGSAPLLWFGGGRLGGDLSLPRLRGRWAGDPQAAVADWGRPPAQRRGSAARLRTQAWTEAGRVVDRARADLSQVPASDRVAWAAAAADAAAALAAVALRVEPDRPGALSRAADELSRCAQLPAAERHAGPSPAGLAGLAGVARTAGDALLAVQGGQVAVAVLLRQLSRLARQIAVAHAAADRAEQARRAHLAAEHVLGWLRQAGSPRSPSGFREPASVRAADRSRPSTAGPARPESDRPR